MRIHSRLAVIGFVGWVAVALAAQQSAPSTTPPAVLPASQPAPPEVAPPPGVLFVAEWKFAEPVTFWSNGRSVESREGYYVGLVVDSSRFVAQNAPRPQVLVGKTSADVFFGGAPAALDGKVNFVVLRVPKLDLSAERFWIGPRVLGEQLNSKLIDDAYSDAEKTGQLAAALTADGLRQASARLRSRAPLESHEALLAAVRQFRDEKDANRTVIEFGPKR
jgi:hypothetical protein